MEIIHIVLGKANPDRLNGVNKVVYNLASEQSKAGQSVQVWGITHHVFHNYPDRNFDTRLFKASWNPFMVPTQLQKAIMENTHAVFHLHGGWIPQFSSIAKLFKTHNIKFVLTPHGAYNEIAMKRSQWRKKIYYCLFEKKLLRAAHKVHALGQSEITGLGNFYQNEKSFLLPYGFQRLPQPHIKNKNQEFTLGFVGRLDTHTKGLDLMMEAFFEFQQIIPSAHLWIIGEGEGKKYIQDFIEDKKIQNVILWGKKFGIEKDLLLQKMDVFVHPSRNEGLPTAVLEAASFGIPSIVSYATNMGEYIRDFHAGVAIANDDASALLDAFHQLYDVYKNGQHCSFQNGAEKMLDEMFAWPVLVEKYAELYR